MLTTIRLTPEEMAVRPVALVGTLQDATPADLAQAPQPSQGGNFNEFRTAGGKDGQQWVVSSFDHAAWTPLSCSHLSAACIKVHSA